MWGGFPYPGSKWSLCVKMFFFSCGFVCRKPIRFDLKNLKLGNFKFSAQNFQSYSFFLVIQKSILCISTHSFSKKKRSISEREREKIGFKSYMVRKKSLCSVGSSCVTNEWYASYPQHMPFLGTKISPSSRKSTPYASNVLRFCTCILLSLCKAS